MILMKTAVLTLVLIGCTSAAFAQLRPPEVRGLRGAPFPSMNPPPEVRSFGEGPAWNGKPPDGVQPLPIDMFTSKDFYKDRALWMDQRYWRCNAPRQIADMRSVLIGPAPGSTGRMFPDTFQLFAVSPAPCTGVLWKVTTVELKVKSPWNPTRLSAGLIVEVVTG